jgi:hypothetical protein
MVTYTFTNGTTAYADEVNQNFNDVTNMRKILTVDNSTDLDVSLTASGTDSANKSYSFTATDIAGADYIEININGQYIRDVDSASTNNREAGHVQTTIEVTAPTPTTLFDKKIVECPTLGTDYNNYTLYEWGINYLHTLTTSEKTNGLTIKITQEAFIANTGNIAGDASFTNSQIIMRNEY